MNGWLCQSVQLCRREKTLGPVSELTKGQAQEKLDALIKATTRQISSEFPADPTSGQIWRRYVELKLASWSTASRKTVQSVFAGEAERHPSILALIRTGRVRELTRDPLQD